MVLTGAQCAGWLRALADQIERDPKVDGEPFKLGPITVQVAQASTLRTHKQRHGTLDPPPASNPSQDLMQETIREAIRDATETLVRRIRDGVETATEKALDRGVSAALDAISSLDLKNTTTSKPDRLSRVVEETGVVVVSKFDETIPGRDGSETLDSNPKIVCPEDLTLTRGQVRRIQADHFIPDELIEPLVRRTASEFVLRWMDDETAKRTIHAWRGSLSKAVVGNWKDGDKRRAILSDHKTPADIEKARAHQRLLEATERKATAEADARRKRLLGPQGVTKGPVPKDVQGAILSLVRGIG